MIKAKVKELKKTECDSEDVRIQKLVLRLKLRNRASAQASRLSAKIRENMLKQEN